MYVYVIYQKGEMRNGASATGIEKFYAYTEGRNGMAQKWKRILRRSIAAVAEVEREEKRWKPDISSIYEASSAKMSYYEIVYEIAEVTEAPGNSK